MFAFSVGGLHLNDVPLHHCKLGYNPFLSAASVGSSQFDDVWVSNMLVACGTIILVMICLCMLLLWVVLLLMALTLF
jgi:hypothetical protein